MTGIRFVYVPAGRFRIGRENGRSNELPSHWVRVSSFWFGETPIVNRQYMQFITATRYREPAFWYDSRLSGSEQPVVGIEWRDAVAFCTWLEETAGIAVKLPSEAQWEYAARGPDGRIYPWGNEPPNAARACFKYSEDHTTAAVDAHLTGRGPFGALDQAGNVWEWCEDVWHERAYDRAPDQLDPVNTRDAPETRALRGGC